MENLLYLLTDRSVLRQYSALNTVVFGPNHCSIRAKLLQYSGQTTAVFGLEYSSLSARILLWCVLSILDFRIFIQDSDLEFMPECTSPKGASAKWQMRKVPDSTPYQQNPRTPTVWVSGDFVDNFVLYVTLFRNRPSNLQTACAMPISDALQRGYRLLPWAGPRSPFR